MQLLLKNLAVKLSTKPSSHDDSGAGLHTNFFHHCPNPVPKHYFIQSQNQNIFSTIVVSNLIHH